MALTMRAASTKAVAARRVQTRAVVRPQAALQQQKAVAGAIATVAIAAAAAAPVSRARCFICTVWAVCVGLNGAGYAWVGSKPQTLTAHTPEQELLSPCTSRPLLPGGVAP